MYPRNNTCSYKSVTTEVLKAFIFIIVLFVLKHVLNIYWLRHFVKNNHTVYTGGFFCLLLRISVEMLRVHLTLVMYLGSWTTSVFAMHLVLCCKDYSLVHRVHVVHLSTKVRK